MCFLSLSLPLSLSLSPSLLFSHWAGISWTSVLGKHSSSTSTAPAPWRTRRDVGMEIGGREGGREGRKDGGGGTENKRVKRMEEEGGGGLRTAQQWKLWKTAIWKWWGRFWVSLLVVIGRRGTTTGDQPSGSHNSTGQAVRARHRTYWDWVDWD